MSIKEKILAALFRLLTVQGLEEAPKERVTKMAQVNAGSAAVAISHMVNKDGLIEYGSEKGTIKLTQQGKDRAAELAPPKDMAMTNEKVHEKIREGLKGMALKVFNILLDGEEHEKAQIMETIRCTNKNSFAVALSAGLKKKDLIAYPSRTTVQLNKKTCFPFHE